MRESRAYYKAYDDRYRRVHAEDLRCFMDGLSPIVGEVMAEFGISKSARLLATK